MTSTSASSPARADAHPRVLGLDPGSRVTGFGVVDVSPRGPCCVDYGTIRPPLAAPLPDRLKVLAEGVRDLVEHFQPDAIVVENVFLGPNVRSMAVVGQVRGALIAAGRMGGVAVFEYAPREIKLSVVGTGSASKRQIQYMVRAALGLPVLPAPFDAADGLAAALCYVHRGLRLGAARALVR
ncbi:MAG: crossover junction endodeoxyribonuclease RuvC [Gemmatimonadota bacterium]